MSSAKTIILILVLIFILTAYGTASDIQTESEITVISVCDDIVTVNSIPAGTDPSAAVYTANDIVYYESGKDFTYGEGSEKDAHSIEEAESHTVVHITEPGTYSLSGSLSRGQIAVDLGEASKNDPEAVVTLMLNGIDVSCGVAPAVIFYNVYECGNPDAENAGWNVDTTTAGANVVIVDGTENTVSGSYVERIYKPDSVVLNDDGTEVDDAEKLHKYDGAFYSKMSMNIFGGSENTGILNINAVNEGLDSEMHLTINGGNINIISGNDGINTNEDGMSVTTINGGVLNISVNGETGESDGIDSNGWLVINGGTVIAEACSHSEDAGIDSDMGIHINGGTVIATGNMLDRIEDGGQNYAVLNFTQKTTENTEIILKDAYENAVMEYTGKNTFSALIYSAPDLEEGSCTLWCGGTQLAGYSGSMYGGAGRPDMMPGGALPEDLTPPEMPEGFEFPEGSNMPEMPEMPDRPAMPQVGEPPMGQAPNEDDEGRERPDGPGMPMQAPDNSMSMDAGLTSEFQIKAGGNIFTDLSPLE